MKTIFGLYWQICLLRKAPQDLPVSPLLTRLTASLYVFVNILLGTVGQSLLTGVVQALLDLALMVIFVQLVLMVKKTPERFAQTFTALVGSGVIISGLALPLVASMSMGNGGDMPSLLWLILFVWNLLISGHILRHALSTSLVTGVFLAGAWTFSVVVLVSLVFPSTPAVG